MNKLLIALGLTLAATTAASAGALDVVGSPELGFAGQNGSAAVSEWDGRNELTQRDASDDSPVYAVPAGGIDYTATAAIGDADGRSVDLSSQPRLGDGSPRFR